MCGRYSFAVEDTLILERFGLRVRTAIYKARYNCAPTQNLAVIANNSPDALQFFRWGLIPSWVKPAVETGHAPSLQSHAPSLHINARAETLVEKPTFKNIFRNRRCLVPATGFFEWVRGPKIPWYIRMKTGNAFCFAGLWDKWMSGNGEIIHSFTIITTSPNELVKHIHDRMPVILHQDDEQRWLTPKHDPSLIDLLKPFPAEMMEAWPVSNLVNSPKNDVPDIMNRIHNIPLL